MTVDRFDQVSLDEVARDPAIFRVDGAGKRTLLTRVPLPATSSWTSATEDLVRQLGEYHLSDCPIARRLLGLGVLSDPVRRFVLHGLLIWVKRFGRQQLSAPHGKHNLFATWRRFG